jgi:hypothetical protein
LEYCGNNFKVTKEFLKNNGRKVVRNTLRKFLAGEILAMEVEEEKVEEKVETKFQQEVFIPTGPNYFDTKLQSHTIYSILDFLDPVSLTMAERTCKNFHEVVKNPLLFRKFCLSYHHTIP